MTTGALRSPAGERTEPGAVATGPAAAEAAPAVVTPPPGNPRFPLLDSLRAVAAMMVLLAHAMLVAAGARGPHVWWNSLVAIGIQGVTVFFVISGFLMYRPFVNAQMNGVPQTPLGRYLRRRALRIIPAYWLALTLLAIYPGLPGVFTHDWWRYYFFLGGYSLNTLIGGIGVAWSLGVEVTFYLALPLYAVLARRLTRGLSVQRAMWVQLALLGMLALGATLLRYFNYRYAVSVGIQDSLLSLFYWFALGMALAVVSAAYQHRPAPRGITLVTQRPAVCWGAALIVYLFLAAINGRVHLYAWEQQILGYYLLGGVFALLLVVPAVLGERGGGWPRRVMAWRPLAWVGLISYGIYLWHLPLIFFMFNHNWFHGFGSLAVIGTAVAVAFASASYYLVERPILRFK